MGEALGRAGVRVEGWSGFVAGGVGVAHFERDPIYLSSTSLRVTLWPAVRRTQ